MNKECLGLRTHPSFVTDHEETGHTVQHGKANANVERVTQKYENRAKNCGRTERAVTSEEKRFLAATREKNGRQLSLLGIKDFVHLVEIQALHFFPFLFKKEFMRQKCFSTIISK